MSRQPSPGPSTLHPHSQSFQQILPSKQRSKPYPTGVAAGAEDLKYQAKYKELKRKVKEIEVDNDKLHLKVLQTKRNIHRMRLERAVLYERLTAVPPSQDVLDRQSAPPIITRSVSGVQPPHSVHHNHQPRDPRDHALPMDTDDRIYMENVQTHGNVRVAPVPTKTPMGPGVAPSLHASRRGSGSGLDSSRQLPPLPSFPPVQHFEPSRVHTLSQPHPRPFSSTHTHVLPTSSLEHTRSNSSSSRSRSHHGQSQVYMSGHGPYPSDTLPPVQHVLHSPPLPAERDRSRRHDVHDHPGSHNDLVHIRHQDALAPHQQPPPLSHGHPVETKASSRIHTHQRIGPGTYINRNEEYHDRDFDRERDREIIRDGEYNSRSPSATGHHRSRSALDRREHQEPPLPSRLREHDGPGYSMFSRSGTPGSGSGSGSGRGPEDGMPQPDPRSFYDTDRTRYALRPMIRHEDVDFVHEDGRSQQTQDRSRGGISSLHEHSRPSLESRKRSRGEMEVDGGNDVVTEAAGSGNLVEGGSAGFHLSEDRGTKRFHSDSSSANLNQGATNSREDVEPQVFAA